MPRSSKVNTAKKKELMLYALEPYFGNVLKSARFCKIATSTHYRWLKEDREYADKSENLRDISYRNMRDFLLEEAVKQIRKGNTHVLNKMLSIYCKNMPDEMRSAARQNNVPIKVGVRFVNRPVDPARTDYVPPPGQEIPVYAREDPRYRGD
jgi:hypothetical protein